MPVSQQLVVSCDYRPCDNILSVNDNMTTDALPEAATTVMADRGWVKFSNGGEHYYCAKHAGEIRPFFPEGTI